MTIPSQPQFPIVVTLGNVSGDIPCRKCGYNLRGLPIDGRCPECAAPVGVSVNGELLRYSSPEYVETLRRGVSLILWGILAIIVVSFSASFLAGATRGSGAPLARILIFLAYIPSVIGAWFLTTPDPSGVGEDQYGRTRKLIRITLAIGLANNLIDFATVAVNPPPSVALALQTLSFLVALIGLVGQFAQLYYLEKLALRIPDGDLSQRAHFLMWAIGISYGLILVIGFFVVLMLRGSGGPGGGPGGAVAGLGCFAGIAAIALIVFGVMYLFMLGRFTTRLREQAALARQHWSAGGGPNVAPLV